MKIKNILLPIRFEKDRAQYRCKFQRNNRFVDLGRSPSKIQMIHRYLDEQIKYYEQLKKTFS